jgi:hypothetical protein
LKEETTAIEGRKIQRRGKQTDKEKNTVTEESEKDRNDEQIKTEIKEETKEESRSFQSKSVQRKS